MMHLFWLSNEAWAAIDPHLPHLHTDHRVSALRERLKEAPDSPQNLSGGVLGVGLKRNEQREIASDGRRCSCQFSA